jgi:ferrochelatase
MDHLEVLYDLDIEAQEIAQDRGIELKRVAMLNDSPALEQALLHIIQNNLT